MTFLPSPRTPTSRIARMEPPMICCMGNDVMRGNHAIQPPYTDGSKRPPFLLCLRNYTPESAPQLLCANKHDHGNREEKRRSRSGSNLPWGNWWWWAEGGEESNSRFSFLPLFLLHPRIPLPPTLILYRGGHKSFVWCKKKSGGFFAVLQRPTWITVGRDINFLKIYYPS